MNLNNDSSVVHAGTGIDEGLVTVTAGLEREQFCAREPSAKLQARLYWVQKARAVPCDHLMKKVVGKRFKQGRPQYRLSWNDSRESSWVPMEHVPSRLMAEYEAHLYYYAKEMNGGSLKKKFSRIICCDVAKESKVQDNQSDPLKQETAPADTPTPMDVDNGNADSNAGDGNAGVNPNAKADGNAGDAANADSSSA